MRIESTSRSGGVSRSGGASSRTGGGFFVDEGEAASRPAAAAPVTQSAGIDALLALQAVDDPLFARRKAVRRGNTLLDMLDRLKADMLLGRVTEGQLDHLMAVIAEARQRNMPGLDAVLDDIELRARVELAKFGRFPRG